MSGQLSLLRYALLTINCSTDCGYLSTTASASGYWVQCCTTDLCNNQTIPNVTSLAALEQCYLGMTPTECLGAPVLLIRLCNYLSASTHLISHSYATLHCPELQNFINLFLVLEHILYSMYTALISRVTAASRVIQLNCTNATRTAISLANAGGTPVNYCIQTLCVIGGTCTANDLAGISSSTFSGSACIVCNPILICVVGLASGRVLCSNILLCAD